MKRGDMLLIGLIVIVALAFLVPRWFESSEKITTRHQRLLILQLMESYLKPLN